MIYIKLIATAIVWGGVFVVSRVMVQDVNPLVLAFYRFLFASVALCVLMVRVEGRFPKLTWKQFAVISFLGLTGIFGYNVLLFTGLKTITASRASLIIALNPITIALCSSIFLKDSLNRLKVVGIALALSGASIVILQSKMSALAVKGLSLGEFFLLGCLVCWTFYTLVGKIALQKISPLVATTYSCMLGSIFLFVFSASNGLLHETSSISPLGWVGIAYMGLVATALGFSWYYEGVQKIGPAKSSIFINLVPLSSVVLSMVFLKEPVTSSLFLGGGLIVSGVFVTTKH